MDTFPFAGSTTPPTPRFPGDRGRGADVPLESAGRSDIVPPGVRLPSREANIPGSPLMPMTQSAPGPLRATQISGTAAPMPTIPPPPDYATVPPPPKEEPAKGMSYFGGRVQEPAWLTQFGKTLRSYVPSAPAGLAAPPAASLLGRAAIQGGVSGTEAALAGKGPLDIAKEAGKGAAISAGAEKVLGPLARFVGKQVGGKAAEAGHEAAVAGQKTAVAEATAVRNAKIAHDKAMTEALNGIEKAAFEAAKSKHAAAGAEAIAKDLAEKVPALKGTEASGKGLYDAIYGAGKEKVNTAFDAALKEIVSKAKGTVIQVPEEVATTLGLKVAGTQGVAGLPANVQALFNKGAQKAGMTVQTPGKIGVDAGELAEKVTGMWKKSPGIYRAAVTALDDAGLGDPAARGAYKTYMGVSDFLDKAKALDAYGNFNPANALKAFADLKKVELLRRRGLGSGTEGMIQQAARGGPLAPQPRIAPPAPPPVSVPEPTKPNLKSFQNPIAGHPWVTGMGAEALTGGLTGSHAYGLPFLAGATLSNALPKQLYTRAPIPALYEQIARLPSLLSAFRYGSTSGPQPQ